MFFRRSKHEREALEQPFPDAWRQRLAYRWPLFTTLSPDERESYGRPVGVTIGPDGSLLVADDVGDVVWRVTGG